MDLVILLDVHLLWFLLFYIRVENVSNEQRAEKETYVAESFNYAIGSPEVLFLNEIVDLGIESKIDHSIGHPD